MINESDDPRCPRSGGPDEAVRVFTEVDWHRLDARDKGKLLTFRIGGSFRGRLAVLKSVAEPGQRRKVLTLLYDGLTAYVVLVLILAVDVWMLFGVQWARGVAIGLGVLTMLAVADAWWQFARADIAAVASTRIAGRRCVAIWLLRRQGETLAGGTCYAGRGITSWSPRGAKLGIDLMTWQLRRLTRRDLVALRAGNRSLAQLYRCKLGAEITPSRGRIGRLLDALRPPLRVVALGDRAESWEVRRTAD